VQKKSAEMTMMMKMRSNGNEDMQDGKEDIWWGTISFSVVVTVGD
jgi:hypothetical protein